MEEVFLSRRNLLQLLSKLDRKAKGESTFCQILKQDTKHKTHPCTTSVLVTAVEDDVYYADRAPGASHPKDDPDLKGN